MRTAPCRHLGVSPCACMIAAAMLAEAPATAVCFAPDPTLYEDVPYFSFADSPFEPMTFEYFHLEDFEDGVLDAPGVSADAGSLAPPGDFTDSVDADDGAIDGLGTGGHSWYMPGSTVNITFDEAVLGRLPTHAGFAWTDIGNGLNIGSVWVEARNCHGQIVVGNGPHNVGDGVVTGFTDEDRFVGVEYGPGIKQLRIIMIDGADFEIDHVQYGSTELLRCQADVAPPSGNGDVGIGDLLAIIGGWGACPSPCTPTTCGEPQCTLDTDGDCVVGIADLLAVIGAWGSCR